MDDGHLSTLIVLFALLVLHGLLALAYAAVVNAPARSDDDEERADRRMHLKERLPRLHLSVELTLLLLRVALVATAAVQVEALLSTDAAAVIPPLGYAAALLPLALLCYVAADLLPRTLARARAETLARAFSVPLLLLDMLLSPLTRLFAALESALTRVSGADVGRSVSEEELIIMVEDGDLASAEKEMIRSVLEFRDTPVREVMVPRLDMVALSVKDTLEEALNVIVESGHSRIPIYDESIDNIKGLLYAKDLLTLLKDSRLEGHTIAELMRPAYFVPESKRADRLFKDMQKSKVHLAVVTDEYGSTAGLVTIEDLVEEIVGDIQDEFDLNEEAEYVQQGTDEYLVDASMILDDFSELLSVKLEDEENDTLGGYIIGRLEHVPEVGEVVETDDLLLRVQSMDGRRIRKVQVIRHPSPHDSGASIEKANNVALLPAPGSGDSFLNGAANREASA